MWLITAKLSQPINQKHWEQNRRIFHLRSVAFINDLHSLMSDFMASFARSSSRSCSCMFSRKYGLSNSASENSRGFKPMISLGWKTVAVFYIEESSCIVKRNVHRLICDLCRQRLQSDHFVSLGKFGNGKLRESEQFPNSTRKSPDKFRNPVRYQIRYFMFWLI
jgi:hypothetical protein